ncbi:indolepyruvate oxidoreductase subunit IorB [Thermoclostridium stercorarium subsp. stercorarium DSM 8532]|jgi:indolepyruvate ferredoxin oxidoreductase beta subunit|uniref:Indolepyruvate oxidoreductase subunit IorB n=3 Tax=Thermoclostridium stercorarium TaxID=1510 RepID=L7VMD1_THES1|nr:indolepyruvate oxidoreductase subunit beta [Thermoclostridium stercorarium]AGC67799.1 indolepyruvate oxidoreductase subunit IorB [Thermoclostridium stercorarium subsp. stercorarium DSM 8532]AGI38843.1 pyruvate-ferredoxin oxidoreductase gamma subunit [Thermoclostridium stercorarium subsp. stercorarium DSM 8532]ANW98201.1 indolepyruvate oxidoreductase subunit beta [Thermoclostridium stercorarium subsp. thermolacticum DSM 2910]ANX00742.1 indolepyruvate oxidoreductase subunit beta [Thermoclostri
MGNVSFLIVGVGGQGTLLTSRVIGAAAVKAGYDVKVSEVHGMAQRGGSVVTYVKTGEKVNSPVIEKGEADILLCFEKLEALRWLDFAKKDGVIIVNDQRIDPMPVITGKEKYPDNIIQQLKAARRNVYAIDALETAKELGNIKALNIVMVGFLARKTGIPKETWHEAIRENVRASFVDLNIRAFDAGYEMAESCMN